MEAQPNLETTMAMRISLLKLGLAPTLALLLFLPLTSSAQEPKSEVLGEVELIGATKVEKTSGVWIDGEYVGYLDELKGAKKVLLLPGEHEVSVRQSGYKDFTEKIIVEPGKKTILRVTMEVDPRFQLPVVTSEIKLKVTPSRAAVFLDDNFVGHVHEFGGAGRKMLVSPGKHRIKIALAGYRPFDTEVNLLPKQKFVLKTDLVKGSITQAGPPIKQP